MNTRNLVAIGVFLFGTTFLWMTPAMSGKQGQEVSGPRWAAVQVLVWVSIIGFSAAAWAVWRSLDWWAPPSLALQWGASPPRWCTCLPYAASRVLPTS
jgi:hypothetical protein